MTEPDATIAEGNSAEQPPPESEIPFPPAMQAARRSPHSQEARTARGFPLVIAQDAADAGLQQTALRALLRATTAEQVVAILSTFIRDLGGALVPARLADPATTLPIDVSLGCSEPMLPYADPVSVAAMRLAQLLPEMVEDARMVVMRLHGDVRRADEATRDPLTGLLTRRAWMRRLAEAEAGDSVCLIDLDRFKTVNDRDGHGAGDQVLRAVGALLLGSFRDDDSCGRYGGDELTCLTPRLSASALAERCEALRTQWDRQRPVCAAGVGFSIGVASVTAQGGRTALRRADEAMYRAKAMGRSRTVIADTARQENL